MERELYLDELFDEEFLKDISVNEISMKAKTMADAARREKRKLTVRSSRVSKTEVRIAIEYVDDDLSEHGGDFGCGVNTALEVARSRIGSYIEFGAYYPEERLKKAEVIATLRGLEPYLCNELELYKELLEEYDKEYSICAAGRFIEGWDAAIEGAINAINDLPEYEYKVSPDEFEERAKLYQDFLEALLEVRQPSQKVRKDS